MTRLGVARAAVAGRLWKIAILTAAGALGGTADAHAARHYYYYYSPDPNPGFSRSEWAISQPRHKARRHQSSRIEASERQAAKPQGPLIIAISIQDQRLRIYDANGFFAETPISRGMPGHPTAMGVFSVIQKHKWHHSNIYSGAPMPYMQRITWSGVAMHAGVLPGHPASHGCIRMPLAFAIKMWNWTRMGARVVVTPGETTPAGFSHPLLAAQKFVPQPSAAAEPPADAPPGQKSDKGAAADATAKSATSAANLELRATVGHTDGIKAVMDQPSAPAALRGQTHTADASHDLSASKPSSTMADAAPSGYNGSARKQPPARSNDAPSFGGGAVSPMAGNANADEASESEVAESEAEPVSVKTSEMAPSEDRPVERKPSAAVTAKTELPATASMKPEPGAGEKKPDAKADDVRTEASQPDAPKASVAPEAIKADIGANVLDLKKNQARLRDANKPVVSKPEPAPLAMPKRSGQIAVFISRKDSRLYVRQNFGPLFDVPVTIAPSDRPLGTHVFTAWVDKDDANLLHWSVVSLPVPARHAERRDEDDRRSRRRKLAGAAEIKQTPVPDSPAEALDRLTIPADAMARITDALTTGGSIIVSDQGINASETGEGTDFIVSLR
jgi:hypothetical protein